MDKIKYPIHFLFLYNITRSFGGLWPLLLQDRMVGLQGTYYGSKKWSMPPPQKKLDHSHPKKITHKKNLYVWAYVSTRLKSTGGKIICIVYNALCTKQGVISFQFPVTDKQTVPICVPICLNNQPILSSVVYDFMYSSVQYSTVQYITIQYSIVQYSIVQCSTLFFL